MEFFLFKEYVILRFDEDRKVLFLFLLDFGLFNICE